MRNLTRFLLIIVLGVFTAVSGYSQITTSGISGKITNAEGVSLPGATIVAVHVPSGTLYGTVTNEEGALNIQGMRPGGPYTVEVSFVGYSKRTYTNVQLYLGETFVLNTTLTLSQLDLGEVTVVGIKSSQFKTTKTGASTNISNEQMMLMPTYSRSISDVARLSPYSNGMSIAAGDGRSTNFTVDGANFNNNFGLGSGLPGGGSPISLEAIEELQVVVAPFDVRQTNFIGGGINAITKSGTNTFKGSAYTYLTNQNLRGNHIDTVDFGVRPKESRNTYGITLGGPIIKNKLFFFVNGGCKLQTVSGWSG
jgi:hypothetical protein